MPVAKRKPKKVKKVRQPAKLLAHLSVRDLEREVELYAGRDGYVRGFHIPGLLHRHDVMRAWSVYGRTISVQFASGSIAKPIDSFDEKHTETESAFDEFLRECTDLGCPRPASYGSVFHAMFKSPKILHSFNAPFADHFTGAWQAHAGAGDYVGTYYKYDLNSAYLWASTLGLPHPSSFRSAEYLGKLPGMFLVEHMPKPHLPYPLNTNPFVLVSTEEIMTYDLHITKVIRGVTWSDYLDGDAITSVMARASFGKQVSRAYWGRWCSTSLLAVTNKSKTWYMRNHVLNIPWAHLLVSRVKMRVWLQSRDAVHIFVDSVITPNPIETSDKLGGWRLEKIYDAGVKIRRAGFYGELASDGWERTSGLAKNKGVANVSTGNCVRCGGAVVGGDGACARCKYQPRRQGNSRNTS